jgi:hypothetical protein
MPDISINNSFLTERARDYAALSDLAYADWSYNGKEWVPNSGENRGRPTHLQICFLGTV